MSKFKFGLLSFASLNPQRRGVVLRKAKLSIGYLNMLLFRKTAITLSGLIWLLGSVVNCAAFAESSATSANTKVELLASAPVLSPGKKITLAIKMTMDPGWHVYWKNPGDSGIPVRVNWILPSAMSAGPIQWPTPKLLPLDPLMSYGYEGEVTFLAEAQVPTNLTVGQDQRLGAKVIFLACQIECVPGEVDVFLNLPVVPATLTQRPDVFASERRRIPVLNELFDINLKVDSRELKLNLRPLNSVAEKLVPSYFYPERSDLINHAEVQRFQKQGKGYVVAIARSTLNTKPVAELTGVLTFLEKPGGASLAAVDVKVMAKEILPGFSLFQGVAGIGWLLVYALIGGLILNLMPCVFPVLGLKVLSLVEEKSNEPTAPNVKGGWFALGIVISFWMLAAVLVCLQAAGKQIGWGFQFQSPVFIFLLSAVFMLLAFSLWGWVELGNSLAMAAGTKQSVRSGAREALINGLLATLAATPCTAPFMGAAIGFAVTQSPMIIFLVFTSLGIGMALPYWLLARNPGWLKWLPRPGKWMVVLKKIMAIPLWATVGWLGWVLWVARGWNAVTFWSVGLLIILISIRLWGLTQRADFPEATRKVTRSLAVLMAALGIFSASLLLVFTQTKVSGLNHPTQGIYWKPFSVDAVNEARGKNIPVLVDFTAAWCLTCQVNDRVSLSDPRVVARIKEKGIVAFKADWTNYDAEITQALASLGKNSIPVYAYYAPGVSTPQLLPELLTPDLVLEALKD